METKIIKKKITIDEFKKIAGQSYGEMVKAVADVEKSILAIGGEFHSDGAEALFKDGSKNENLWGINIYLDKDRSKDDWIEYNSLINIKPLFNNRSMEIENIAIKEKIKKIVNDLIQ